MSLIGALRSAVQSLSVTQAQFQIASTNIANATSEGFSRKTATTSSIVVDGVAGGVRLTDIQRQVDAALIGRVREQTTIVGRLDTRNQYLARIQQLFGTLGDNSSIGHSTSRLGAAFESLATLPDNAASNYNVVDQAVLLASQLAGMTEELQRIRTEADQEIDLAVNDINAKLSAIDGLNMQIIAAQNVGAPIGELADQRDTLVAALAREIDISVIERTNGEVAIYTSGGRSLLDNGVTTLAHTGAAQVGPTVSLGNGIGGIDYSSSAIDITSEITGGRLAALIEVRDVLAVDLQAEIDGFAETLRAAINAQHNNGTAYPVPTTLTGTQTLAGTDAPTMSGFFRVTVVDGNGEVVETNDIDLSGTADVAAVVAAINAMANVTASIDAAGHVIVAATGGNGISVNELTSAVTSGNNTTGLAQFLGLNDFFTGPTAYAMMMTDRVSSATAALGLAGTLTFGHGGATTAVNYAAGDSITAIAASISAALAGQNVTATVLREGTGFRVQIEDIDGDNLFVTDSGGLTAAINLRAGQAGMAGLIQVRDQLQTNPALVAHAESSAAAGLAVGDVAVSLGDGAAARGMANAFSNNLSFGRAGSLAATQTRLADYAGSIVATNAMLASNASDASDAAASHYQSLVTQAASVSQVNLDEEMANIIVLQNAYGAAARVTSAANEMLDLLVNLGK